MSARRTLASASVSLPNAQRCSYADDYQTQGQVGKVLGERWKALNEKQRTPYEAKAAQDKKRYEDEKAQYNVSAEKPVGVRKRTARGTD
jgi:hypothetical protein